MIHFHVWKRPRSEWSDWVLVLPFTLSFRNRSSSNVRGENNNLIWSTFNCSVNMVSVPSSFSLLQSVAPGQNNDLASRSERRLFLCGDEIFSGVFCFTMGRGPCNLPACCAWCSNVISWIFLQRESSYSLRRLIKAGVSLWPCHRDGGASSGLHHHSALIGWVLVKWPPALGMGHCNPPLCPVLSHIPALYCPCLCMQVSVRS